MAKKSSGYNAPVLYKAFSILEEIAYNQTELGISDLARKLDIPKSTVYGIVQALKEVGALRQSEKTHKYKLGPTLVRLGNRALSEINIRSIARPYMEKLSAEFKETIFMGVFDEQRVTIIEKAESPLDLKISAPIGTRISIFAGATGKIFLSRMRKKKLEKILKEKALPKFTENSITDPKKYLQELEEVRRLGYAKDFEEYIRGVNAISVPLLPDSWGWPAAALWMVGFSSSFTGEKLEEAITASIKEASEITEIVKETAASIHSKP
ncbi:MAG TPA: IclR family transcriptional regulator [Firmicutes bacterium]|jgi:IclR family KDG regulon transcriptional repressor|nr:IclR family transcriptional regulator [Bacillota bacterium]